MRILQYATSVQHTLGFLLTREICDKAGDYMHYFSLCPEVLSSVYLKKNLKHVEDEFSHL